MKKLFAILLIFVLSFSIVGCGGEEVISPEIITEAMLSFRYQHGGFSIPMRELLPQCAPDYEASYSTYEGSKKEKLSKDQIAEYESSGIKEFLDTAYFVTVTGCIMENPEIPYMVSEEQEIITFLILFDDNDNVKGHIIVNECRQLSTCAILLMTNY